MIRPSLPIIWPTMSLGAVTKIVITPSTSLEVMEMFSGVATIALIMYSAVSNRVDMR